MSEKEQKVGDNMVVSLAYTLLVNGEELDSADEGDPMLFLQGHGNIIPGLEKELYGMGIGDSKEEKEAAAVMYCLSALQRFEGMSKEAITAVVGEIALLGQTGLGVKITSLIVNLSGGWLPAALLLTALACLILGMEVPTTAAYVICVSVAGPALQKLGLEPLHAHLFVFWYALLSTITPPVCGTVFIAAGMGGVYQTCGMCHKKYQGKF